MIVHSVTTLNKNWTSTKTFLVDDIPKRVYMLKDWAEYFIADGEEDNVKEVVVYGSAPEGTVVPYDGKNPTCDAVSSLIDADTQKVVINCIDGNVLTATASVFEHNSESGIWVECSLAENK